MHKISPISIQTSSERNFGAIFAKFLPSVPWRVESSKIFKEIKKNFKIPKMPKIVPKSIQTCFEQVLGLIFRKFLAHFSMEGRVFEDFQKKSKSFQNSKDAQKRSQKYPHVIWTCFGAFCSKNFCPVFHGGSSLLKIENSRKSVKNPNMPKIVPKNVQMCFEHVLWQFFRKFS